MIKWIAFIFVFVYSYCIHAQQQDLQNMDQDLKLVNPSTSSFKKPVSVSWALKDKFLWVTFDVKIPVQYGKKKYGPKDYPFQFDVVEVFIAVGKTHETNLPYYEFELTPYNQTLEVKISDLTKPFDLGITTGSEAIATLTKTGWTGEFKIPLENLNWSGDAKDIRGNFFAIFGKSPRTYWSLYLEPQKKANFHKPEFFKPLF